MFHCSKELNIRIEWNKIIILLLRRFFSQCCIENFSNDIYHCKDTSEMHSDLEIKKIESVIFLIADF